MIRIISKKAYSLSHRAYTPPIGRGNPPALRCILVVFLVVSVSFTTAAHTAMRTTLTPRISLSHEYDDNIDLDAENAISDWITTASPGLLLSLESMRTRMSLDYESGFSYYRDDSSRDSVRHQGTGRWDHQVGQHLRIEARDTFTRSEDPILMGDEGEIAGVFRERAVYYRNTGEFNLTFQYRAEDRIVFGYQNRYLDSKSNRLEDSLGHEGFIQLDTWFVPQFGTSLATRITRGKFEQPDGFDPARDASEDFYQYGAGLTLNYRWSQSRRMYCDYILLYQDFDEIPPSRRTNDFRVHQGALGFNLGFGRHAEFNAEGGLYRQDFLTGATRDGESYIIGLRTRSEHASLRLEGSGGYEQDYFSSENLGSTRFNQASVAITSQLSRNSNASASTSYRWADSFGEDNQRDRSDEVWRISGGIFMFPRQWLTLSFVATRTEQKSDDPTLEFIDNRFMIRITGAHPFSL